MDGVGDYTLSLASECLELGLHTEVIGMRDRFVGVSGFASKEEKVGSKVKTIRYKNAFDAESLENFKKDVVDRNPDWISLQFVGYGFHPKGVVYDLADKLVRVVRDRKVHIMLHELWIGESTEYSLKDRLVGFVQKRGVIRLIKKLNPTVLHTSNSAYKLILERNGISALELPLFGNILVSKNPEFQEFYALMKSYGVNFDSDSKKNFVLVGFFGTIHPGWDPSAFFSQLGKHQKMSGNKPVLIAIGKKGRKGEKIWEDISNRFGEKFVFINFGQQRAEIISLVMQILDLGVCTTPWALCGKSGTAAAMVDHGLPVVFVRDEWCLRRGITPSPAPNPLFSKLDIHFAERLNEGLKRRSPNHRLPSIARRFVKDLSI